MFHHFFSCCTETVFQLVLKTWFLHDMNHVLVCHVFHCQKSSKLKIRTGVEKKSYTMLTLSKNLISQCSKATCFTWQNSQFIRLIYCLSISVWCVRARARELGQYWSPISEGPISLHTVKTEAISMKSLLLRRLTGKPSLVGGCRVS